MDNRYCYHYEKLFNQLTFDELMKCAEENEICEDCSRWQFAEYEEECSGGKGNAEA